MDEIKSIEDKNNNINNSLNELYNEHFKPIIDEAKEKLNTNFIDKSYVLNLVYKPTILNYQYPCKYHTNNKNILSMIKTSKANDFADFVINYKFYFYIILKHSITNKNSMKTITNHIKYFTIIFRDLITHNIEMSMEDKIILQQIHFYFRNILSTFNFFIIEFKERQNKLNSIEKLNYMKYEDILKIYKELKNDSLEQNIKKVLLGLYILEAPSRIEMMHTKFIIDISNNDLINDFIFLDKENNNIEIIFNKQKKSHKDIKYTVINNELKELLFDSYNRYPRTNVICSIINKDKSINQLQKTKYLKSINPCFGVNMLRSSYYTFHAPLYNNYNEMNNDAFKSRTSVNTIIKNYCKKP